MGPWLRINGTCPLDRKKVGDGEERRREREREQEGVRRGIQGLMVRDEDRNLVGGGVEREKEEERRREEDEESDGDDGMYA